MKVIYKTADQPAMLISLTNLILTFNTTNGWQYHASAEHMRQELESKGWCEGVHDVPYIVFDPDRLGCEPLPEVHDGYKETCNAVSPDDFSIISEGQGRDELFYVLRSGKIVETFYDRGEARLFIAETCGVELETVEDK